MPRPLSVPFDHRHRCSIGVPYSSSQTIADQLSGTCQRVLLPSYVDLPTILFRTFAELRNRCIAAGERLIIHEVGGRCGPLLMADPYLSQRCCIGVVEDTTFGRRVYEQLRSVLPVPVFHVAASRLKLLEAMFVGEAVATQTQALLNTIGRRLAGLPTGVLGFGPIGESVAHALRRRLAHIAIYDIDSIQMVRAAFAGFTTAPRQDVLRNSHLIIGATGHPSIHPEDLDSLCSHAVLASASSGQVELPVSALIARATDQDSSLAAIRRYTLSPDHHLFLLRDGFPVNFAGNSVPHDVIDLVFSEIYLALRTLLVDPPPPGLYAVPHEFEVLTADQWLSMHLPNKK
jgi:adenosylhomocysteinase